MVYGKKENTHFPGFDFGAVDEFGFETEMGIRISGTYSWELATSVPMWLKENTSLRLTTAWGSICLSYMFASVK
ncbi:MAG: hypothetical protein R2778_10435 [Saprospiraceae bacterium]